MREITDGKGVQVVYDGVGKDTFQASLNSLAPRGMLVSFGNASEPVPAFEPAVLAAKGSLFLTRPILGHYIATREELLESAGALFDVVRNGAVKIEVRQTYALKDAAQAHRDLEARLTTGSTVWLPWPRAVIRMRLRFIMRDSATCWNTPGIRLRRARCFATTGAGQAVPAQAATPQDFKP